MENGRKKLLYEVGKLAGGDLGKIVEQRKKEFRDTGKKGPDALFCELCFCILTANYSAAPAIRIQEKIGEGFVNLCETDLAGRLAELGHRFPNKRAEYICASRKNRRDIENAIKGIKDQKKLRDWLASNVKGLGYKEASHFLRNVGYSDLAIIDFHIIDVLERYGIIRKPATLTKKKYLEIEETLRAIAKDLCMNLSELDLYLWYMETGKILK